MVPPRKWYWDDRCILLPAPERQTVRLWAEGKPMKRSMLATWLRLEDVMRFAASVPLSC